MKEETLVPVSLVKVKTRSCVVSEGRDSLVPVSLVKVKTLVPVSSVKEETLLFLCRCSQQCVPAIVPKPMLMALSVAVLQVRMCVHLHTNHFCKHNVL